MKSRVRGVASLQQSTSCCNNIFVKTDLSQRGTNLTADNMLCIRFFPLLLFLASPLYIRGDDSEELKSMVQDQTARVNELTMLVKALTETVHSQSEMIQQQQENIEDLHESLDNRLRENDLKIEWALTDGTLAPKNTSSVMENLARQENKLDRALDALGDHGCTFLPGSCAEIDGGQASGVVHIYPSHKQPVPARCEAISGGGWTVIQKRFDGSVDFFRGWEDYAQGFGDPAGEHWLGLHHIHALTKAKPMELYVGVTDFGSGFHYAKYASFSVSSEVDNFRLHIRGYSGNAGDSLRYHNGQPFSTKDEDHDSSSLSCSERYHGAWWYKKCHLSNLNGMFSQVKVVNPNYMTWTKLNGDYSSMKDTVMMIRPSNFRP